MKHRRSGTGAVDESTYDAAKENAAQSENVADEEDPDANALDPALLKEEQAAKQAREKAAKQKPQQELTKEKLQKLDKLVEQATMYSEFLVEQVNSVKDQWEQVSCWHLCATCWIERDRASRAYALGAMISSLQADWLIRGFLLPAQASL